VSARSPTPAAGASAEEALGFLCDLAGALHVAYVPSDLVELRVRAAARGLGLEVDAFALQSAVLLQPRGEGAARLLRAEFNPHWELDRLHQLAALADELAGGRLALPAARAELDRILAAPRPFPKPVVVLGYAVYAAAVAARVGGGVVELLAAGLVGVLAGAIHFGVLAHPTVDLQKGFLAAFVATLAALLLCLVLPPFDAGRAVFGALTLLVPAMVVTLAAYELANEAAVESGVVRLAYGLLRFLMIGAGALAALRLWSLLAPAPPRVEAVPLPVAAVAAILAVGGVALAACMQARPADMPWIVGAVLLAWGTQEATKLVGIGQGSPFVAAFLLAVAGSLYGRLPGKIPATVLFPAMMQLAPGFLGTRAVLTSLQPDAVATPETLVDMLVVAVQLVLGLIVGAAVSRGLRRGTPSGTAG
jgi:uncharacterized membrane protein YjjP (DUF1212 family)